MKTDTKQNFLQACHRQPVSHTPVWFMRQAGRSLPEYRAVRGEGSILDAIKQPQLSTEITMQPVHRYGVDAAVLQSIGYIIPGLIAYWIASTFGEAGISALNLLLIFGLAAVCWLCSRKGGASLPVVGNITTFPRPTTQRCTSSL